MKYYSSFVICFTLFATTLLPQQTTTTGNLVRFNFIKNNSERPDTLWNWKNESTPFGYGIGQTFLREVNINNNKYVVYREYNTSPALEILSIKLYNETKGTTKQLYSNFAFIDPMEPLLYLKPQSKFYNNGCWLYFGIIRKAIFIRNDSLYQGESENQLNMIHNAGKIGDKDLVIFQKPTSRYRFMLYLTDLSLSPKINMGQNIEVWENGKISTMIPFFIHHLSDSLYLFKQDFSYDLYLSSFSNNRLNILKLLKPDEDPLQRYNPLRLFCHEKTLYYFENSRLYKEYFDTSTMSFTNKKNVKDFTQSPYIYDTDSSYISLWTDDSLHVYSVLKEKIIYSIKKTFQTQPTAYSLGAPYIYIPQVKTITEIDEVGRIPFNYALSQNYPNPFNPETTIEYSIPKPEHLTIKIFDVLGREVATLVDEYKQAGAYKANFNASGLVSGVYFYQISAGSYVETKKLVLLK